MAGLGTAKYVVVRGGARRPHRHAGARRPATPESALCDEYGVSRITLRRAVEDLVDEADSSANRDEARS